MGRRITKLKITELSAVDRPANNLALVDSMELVKRLEPPPQLTTEEVGGIRKFLRTLFRGEPEILEHIEKKSSKGAESKSKKQVGYLLSDASPLTEEQKKKLKEELHSGKVKVKDEKGEDIVDIAKFLEEIEKVAERSDVNPDEGKKEYGDVNFADAKNKKYPLDSEQHVRAAWSYINMPKNAAKYSSGDVATIKAKIKAAGKKYGITFNDEKADTDIDLGVGCDKIDADEILLADTTEDIAKQFDYVMAATAVLSQLDDLSKNTTQEVVPVFRDAISDALDEFIQKEESGEKLMALSAEAEQLLKDYREGTGIFAKAADAPTQPTTEPATQPEVKEAMKTPVAKAGEAEIAALAQGAHDAMSAAGAPPHNVTEGGDDVGEGKADMYCDLIKSAAGIDEQTRTDMTTLIKRGAKFSGATGQHLKKAHDLMKAIGAKCDMDEMDKGLNAASLQKMLDNAIAKATSVFEKKLEEKDTKIAELEERVAKAAHQPEPLPMGPHGQTLQLRVAERNGSLAPYQAPGTVTKADQPAENVVAPNGARVSKVATEVNEILPGLKKIHQEEGRSDITELYTS
jgi:hypothetical protein